MIVRPHHKALVFDCDGTLADTMPAHFVAWTQTLRRFGLDHLFPHERFIAMGGVPALQILRTLSAEGGVELDAQRVAVEKEAAFVEASGDVQPVEAVIAIARQHVGRLPMAVATGGHRHAVFHTLTALGIVDWFDAVVASEDVTDPKPHPETFLRCAERLGIAPADCLAFEDADPGLAAARAAGMEVVDVRTL